MLTLKRTTIKIVIYEQFELGLNGKRETVINAERK